jgi:hypothetical protein
MGMILFIDYICKLQYEYFILFYFVYMLKFQCNEVLWTDRLYLL